MKNKLPDVNILEQYYSYDPDKGTLTELATDCVVTNVRVSINGTDYSRVQVCYKLYHKEEPNGELRFKDRNIHNIKLDNLLTSKPKGYTSKKRRYKKEPSWDELAIRSWYFAFIRIYNRAPASTDWRYSTNAPVTCNDIKSKFPSYTAFKNHYGINKKPSTLL